MVVFVDLESDDDDTSLRTRYAQRRSQLTTGDQSARHSNEQDARETGFAAVLTCYPIACTLSSYLDLNDLYALSLTCRSVHSSLAQYAPRLKANSLRCTFDGHPLLSDLLAARLTTTVNDNNDEIQSANAIPQSANVPYRSRYAFVGPATRWSASKICSCARDLVKECGRCGTIVCRNCTSKAPSDKYLKERHRRLCQKCLKAPLLAHLQPLKPIEEISMFDTPPASSASSVRSARSESASSAEASIDGAEPADSIPEAFTSAAFLREPCACATRGVYLCLSCGHNLLASNTTYKRVWTWRSRYSTHIGGGLGTGLGVGNQGQKCGRGDQCLDDGANSISWVEIDCSEGHGGEDGHEFEPLTTSRVGTPLLDGVGSGTTTNRPGYLQQEIEGIGGVVKKKVKKKVKVGATVWEYDEERKDPRRYLEREATGKERSWCGWCGRVCLGDQDRLVSS